MSAFDELKALSCSQRIDAVSEDVSSGRDRYKDIDAHELAELLGVPTADQPDGHWEFGYFTNRIVLSEYVQTNDVFWTDEMLEELKNAVPNDRFRVIEGMEESPEIDRLLDSEIELLETLICNGQYAGGFYWVYANYSLQDSQGRNLRFQGFIEDDGDCIELSTPYDKRDKKFAEDNPDLVWMEGA